MLRPDPDALLLAFSSKQPTGIQYLFMRGLFVVGIAALAVSALVGTVNLKWGLGKSLVVTATGGFALLILLYLCNPPAPPSPTPQGGTLTTNISLKTD